MEDTSRETFTMKTVILILTVCVSAVKCQGDTMCNYIPTADPYHVLAIHGRCYHMVQDAITWTEATTRCRARNGTLAIVRDSETNKLLIQRAMDLDLNDKAEVSFYWIGGSIQTTGAAITWQRDINGDEVTNPFTAFLDGEPVGSGSNGCLLLDPSEMGWATDFCNVSLELTGYVCELASGSMSYLRSGTSKLLLTFLLTVVLGHVV
ncbi:C-type lectin domain family 3 member A homolog [Pecten maximus]|uniref:C-type lectin domain family 3 member A homolog n=1 Tax=Pecten maximus TaxID=6579 RepID=UPI001459020B|nr:C-type lectin domain family 3 member A homolog [Pecten maximus]